MEMSLMMLCPNVLALDEMWLTSYILRASEVHWAVKEWCTKISCQCTMSEVRGVWCAQNLSQTALVDVI
jgi:hypothetical protein